MYRIGKTFKFEAAHNLPDHDGKCATLHGHSYEVEVVLESAELLGNSAKDGMLLDFGDLKDAVAPLIDLLDHNGLVQDVIRMRSTAENIARWFQVRLDSDLDAMVHSVRVSETRSTFAEYIHDDCPA